MPPLLLKGGEDAANRVSATETANGASIAAATAAKAATFSSPTTGGEWADDDERLLFEWAWQRGLDRSAPIRPAMCPESGCRGLVRSIYTYALFLSNSYLLKTLLSHLTSSCSGSIPTPGFRDSVLMILVYSPHQIATRHIEEGEVLLRIPHELLMSTDTALRDLEVFEMVQAAEKEGLDMKGKLVLAMHLLVERGKGEASAWYRFIRSLPEHYDTYENWAEEELSWLQFPDLIVLPPNPSSQLLVASSVCRLEGGVCRVEG
jgi:hypothetical protein